MQASPINTSIIGDYIIQEIGLFNSKMIYKQNL